MAAALQRGSCYHSSLACVQMLLLRLSSGTVLGQMPNGHEHLVPRVRRSPTPGLYCQGPEQQNLAGKSLFAPLRKSRAEFSSRPLTSCTIFHQPRNHLAPASRGPQGSASTHTSPCQRCATSDAAAAHSTLGFWSGSRQTQQGTAAPCLGWTCPDAVSALRLPR